MKKLIIIFGFAFLLFCAPALAETFPNNAISFYQDLTVNTTIKQELLGTSTRTLLYATITQQKIDLTTKLFCGDTEILDTNYNTYTEVFLSSDCAFPIYAQTTPQKNTQVSVHITFTDYDLSATTTPVLITNFPPVQNVFITNWPDETGTTTAGSSTPFNMINDIGLIGFSATTSGGQTSGVLYVPFALFVYAFVVIATITILVLYLIGKYINKK